MTTHAWIELYYLSERVIQVVMLVVILRRRRRLTAVAWLLIIFFLPWVGLALYYLIGENKLPQQRIRKHASLMHSLRRRISFRSVKEAGRSLETSEEIDAAVSLAQRLGHMPVVSGNCLELLGQPYGVIERLIADIDAARHHVHMLYFIWANDETGHRVAEALRRAAQRGVACRILVDSVGSRHMLKRLAKELRTSGVQVQEALAVGRIRRRMARLDVRNHRKLTVIDGEIAYVGSQNVVNPGIGKRRLWRHDLTSRLTGPAIHELQAVFAADWFYETDELLEGAAYFPVTMPTGKVQVQALPSGPNYPTQNYHRMVVSAIFGARRSVTITTPYFVPDDSMLHAFEVARLRDVRIDLILPARSDHSMVDAAARSYFQELLDCGVHVYLFRDGLLHAKTITIDDAFCMVGSSNFDIRSFELNFELNLMFYDRDATSQVREQQRAYQDAADELFLSHWERRPLRQRVWQNLAHLLGPLL